MTAGVEYTGVIVPIDFDERYLRAIRVEERFLSGTAIIDNEDAVDGAQAEEGYVVIASNLGGTRRVAAAGEEFHAATVFFEVLETAAAIGRTRLDSRPVGGRVSNPLVVVRHLSGEHADAVEVTSEVGAIEVAGGVLAIRASLETTRGDGNFDDRFDIGDPVSLLGYLFLGGDALLCPEAADYNGDGELLIDDAIDMRGALFLSRSPRLVEAPERVACR